MLKKCIAFRECKSNIHVTNYSIAQNFSNISYQSLVAQQRTITRNFVGELRDRRNGIYLPPPPEDRSVTFRDGRNTGCDMRQSNLIHDIFMDSHNIFSGTGFGTNQRAFAAVAQMGITSNSDALNDVFLSDLKPCIAWV